MMHAVAWLAEKGGEGSKWFIMNQSASGQSVYLLLKCIKKARLELILTGSISKVYKLLISFSSSIFALQ